MTKFIIILLLVVICIAFIGGIEVHILAKYPTHHPSMARLPVSNWKFDIALLCLAVAILIARCIDQVERSAQILLSFFFYSWRNSIYDEDIRRFAALFSGLETETCF